MTDVDFTGLQLFRTMADNREALSADLEVRLMSSGNLWWRAAFGLAQVAERNVLTLSAADWNMLSGAGAVLLSRCHRQTDDHSLADELINDMLLGLGR